MPLLDDARNALQDLRAAIDADEGGIGCHVFLYAHRGRSREDKWRRVAMDATLAEKFIEAGRKSFVELHAQLIATPDNLTEFDFDDMATGSIGVIKKGEAAELADWMDAIPTDDWPNIFQGDEEFVDKVRFYATRITFPDGRTLKTFRNKRGVELLLSVRGPISAFFRPDSDEMTLADRTIVSFDQRFDFFEWDGFVYVGNLQSFEALTNVREITANKAGEMIDAVAQKVSVSQCAKLKEKIAQRTKLSKKLAAAAKHLVPENLNGARMATRIAEKGLPIKCELINGSYHLVVDPEDDLQVQEFVNLVTEFYLQSPLTGREWKAYVKKPA